MGTWGEERAGGGRRGTGGGGVPASGCSSAEHRREADGGRPSAQNEEAVVEAWDSHGGNWRRMLTQDQWKIAEQS